MYDDTILKIVETYMQIVNETNFSVELRIARRSIEVSIYDSADFELINRYTAYIIKNNELQTQRALTNILIILTMIKNGKTVA